MQPTYYKVTFVEDVEMPPGLDWLLVQVDDEVHCIIRQSHVCPEVLEDAWAGYRRLAHTA